MKSKENFIDSLNQIKESIDDLKFVLTCNNEAYSNSTVESVLQGYSSLPDWLKTSIDTFLEEEKNTLIKDLD